MITVDTTEIEILNRNLQTYAKTIKLTEDEILNKKGNDLRIQLFRGFWARRWKKGKRNGAIKLMHSLHSQRKGLLLRPGGGELKSKWASQIPETGPSGRALTLWQKLQWQEALRRQSGVGVLGVSFLRKRWRYKKERSYLAVNKTNGMGKAVTFEKRDGAFIITGFTPGLAAVAQRYGVLNEAIAKVNADTVKYLRRKMMPVFEKVVTTGTP